MAPLVVIVLGAFWYAAVALGVTVGYHRVLAHRAARVSRPVLRLIVWAGLPAGPPAEWVGNHRVHHRRADRAGDPHCPSRDGFWFAHAGWYLGIESPTLAALYALSGPLRLLIDAAFKPMLPGGHSAEAPDVTRDPWFCFMSTRRGYALCALPHLVPLVAAAATFGARGLGLAWLLGIAMYNVGDWVNSGLHLWGRREFSTPDASRNAAWLALLTLGESFHNGHHAFPWSARHGLLPGQLDLAFAFLRLLARLGLASALRLPSPSAIAEKRLCAAPDGAGGAREAA